MVQSADRHRSLPGPRLDSVADVLILLGLGCSWLGLLGGWHWTFDLLSHFRWQYLIASTVALAWAAWRRRRGLLLAATVTLLLNAGLIGRLAWPSGVGRASLQHDFKLRVLSLNVLTSNPGRDRVLEHLREADADVIFLMEVNDEWIRALREIENRYPQRMRLPRDDNFGVALYSRVPSTRLRALSLGEAEVPSVEILIHHHGRELAIIGTHPLPPAGFEYATLRDQQLRMLAGHVAGLSVPVLVVGDLNVTPWSAGMRLARAGEGLDYRSLAPAWSPTWRVGSVFAIPIDHALCTAPLVVVKRTVGPDVGSDHRSLLLEIGWSQ